MSKGLIFVRVSDVLSSGRTLAAAREVNTRSLVDPVAMALLGVLCRETGAEVILAGTLYGRVGASPSAWNAVINELQLSLPIVDVISEAEGPLESFETAYLRRWLKAKRPANVVLDTRPCDRPPAINELRWIQVDRRVGLSLGDCIQVLEHLAPQSPELIQLRLIEADKMSTAGL